MSKQPLNFLYESQVPQHTYTKITLANETMILRNLQWTWVYSGLVKNPKLLTGVRVDSSGDLIATPVRGVCLKECIIVVDESQVKNAERLYPAVDGSLLVTWQGLEAQLLGAGKSLAEYASRKTTNSLINELVTSAMNRLGAGNMHKNKRAKKRTG